MMINKAMMNSLAS